VSTMAKQYVCVVDSKTDTLTCTLTSTTDFDKHDQRTVQISTQRDKDDKSSGAAVLMSREDALDLATRIMAWIVHKQTE